MVNGVILVVDAFEGVMPQTKFVLMKALELSLPVIVCLNKVDRPEARPNEVVDEVLELFMDLDASDEQLDCPFLFASARDGYAVREIGDLVNNKKDMTPLFETIIDYIPAPEGDPDANTQVLISTIDYNEYVGRIGIGKVDNGCLKVNQEAVVVNHHEPDKQKKVRISKLYEFDGLNKVDVAEAKIGSIVAISGIADIHIGDTICAPENPVAIPFQKISEPTLSMNFMVNDSPLCFSSSSTRVVLPWSTCAIMAILRTSSRFIFIYKISLSCVKCINCNIRLKNQPIYFIIFVGFCNIFLFKNLTKVVITFVFLSTCSMKI